MELVAAQGPFLSFPLEARFEQRLHVAHRLARHGVSAPLEYRSATPEGIAHAILAECAGEGRRRHRLPAVPAGRTERAAALIAPLLACRHSGAA